MCAGSSILHEESKLSRGGAESSENLKRRIRDFHSALLQERSGIFVFVTNGRFVQSTGRTVIEDLLCCSRRSVAWPPCRSSNGDGKMEVRLLAGFLQLV